MSDDLFPDSGIEEQASSQLVRPSIADQVNQVLWLDHLDHENDQYEQRITQGSATEKCMVCTLPFGCCEHTREWIEEAYR
ncbi:hypothetical protein B484DRAFT_401954, partial [Ochromonadaceae sp. CCMP2298]